MIRSFSGLKKSILVFAAVLALAVSFMPVNAGRVYAAKTAQTVPISGSSIRPEFSAAGLMKR